MLDSRAMSTWRRFLLVILLALSLPAQAFAAASTMLGLPHHGNGDAAFCLHTHAHARYASIAMQAEHDRPTAHPGGCSHAGAHSAHPCSTCFTCSSCCFGAALPTAVQSVRSIDAARLTRFPPLSAADASFLTGGIERPPRLSHL
ncbi:hypothetical protein DWV00_08545 [Trinickia dinghuensis]|uniref:DUF2946 domain-containing protein n=1 Tax=Trinickia dinghuensis TaxID=2291023 RepID=A0A3D8K2P3_9BURK|nr:hypothetical protein DWV00_08545 [Trinickia dinghuensis]